MNSISKLIILTSVNLLENRLYKKPLKVVIFILINTSIVKIFITIR